MHPSSEENLDDDYLHLDAAYAMVEDAIPQFKCIMRSLSITIEDMEALVARLSERVKIYADAVPLNDEAKVRHERLLVAENALFSTFAYRLDAGDITPNEAAVGLCALSAGVLEAVYDNCVVIEPEDDDTSDDVINIDMI